MVGRTNRRRFPARPRARGTLPKQLASATSSVPHPLRNIPLDPPTIKASPLVNRIIGQTIVATSGSINITVGTISTAIYAQLFGSATVNGRYQIQKICVWGPGGVTGSISLADEVNEVTSFDYGSFSQRPKAGIAYAPPARKTYTLLSSDTTSLYNIKTSGDGDLVDVQISAIVWTRSSPDL